MNFSILKSNNIKVLIIGLSILCSNLNNGQSYKSKDFQNIKPIEKIDKKSWEKHASKYDYSQDLLHSDTLNEKSNVVKTRKSDTLSAEQKEVLKYGLFAIVILFLVFIMYKLLAGSLLRITNEEKMKVYSLNDLEKDLIKIPISGFLDEAIANSNYRLAIRLLYLNIVQLLSIKELIIWKKDKTNGDYMKELYGSTYLDEFLLCTNYYERVWFNEIKNFDKLEFLEMRPRFDDMISSLQNDKN